MNLNMDFEKRLVLRTQDMDWVRRGLGFAPHIYLFIIPMWMKKQSF